MGFMITPWIALIVFALIILFSIAVAFFMKNYENFDKSKIRVFTATLAGLGIIVTMLFYYSIVIVQQNQQQLTAIQETARIFDDVNDTILNEIKEASEFIPCFTDSLLPLLICEDHPDPDEESTDNCTRRYILSYKIFSVWQDVGLSTKFIRVEDNAYLANFLQYANSKQLYEQWKVTKLNFNDETQKLGNLLFKYGLPIKKQTPESYIKAAERLSDDPEYQALSK